MASFFFLAEYFRGSRDVGAFGSQRRWCLHLLNDKFELLLAWVMQDGKGVVMRESKRVAVREVQGPAVRGWRMGDAGGWAMRG